MFSESNAEAYIGDLHGNMALYGWERCGSVPAFQAVYSGWTVNAGILEQLATGGRVILTVLTTIGPC